MDIRNVERGLGIDLATHGSKVKRGGHWVAKAWVLACGADLDLVVMIVEDLDVTTAERESSDHVPDLSREA
jgi:hypothetical protein